MLEEQRPYRNQKLLRYAKNQACQIRLPGVCNSDRSTVVAAHIREHEFGAGVGLKPDDCCIAFVCSACHDQIDGRTKRFFEKDWLDQQVYKAAIRTLRILIREGILK